MTNEEIARGYYESRMRGDVEAFWREHVADDVGYHLPARSPLGGEFHGKPAVRKAIAAVFERCDNTFKVEILDIASSARHAVALVRATAQRVGRTLDSEQVHVFELRDGRITNIWIYGYDRYAIDEFWS